MTWTRSKFIKEFGEDPVDIFGQDWKNYMDGYEPIGNNAEPIKNLPEDDRREDR
jgi:hypothetical protein